VEKGYLLLVCLLESVWSDVVASLLESFWGISADSSVWLPWRRASYYRGI